MNEPETPKCWDRTKVQNLVRRQSGIYYARLFKNGKESWKSLRTSHLSVARAKLAETLKDHRENQSREIDTNNAKLTFGEASTLHMEHLEADAEVKRRTKKYYRELLAALSKDWPKLAATEIRRIDPSALKRWAAGYVAKFSASRYNGTLALLRAIFELAVESGVIFSNPAASLTRRAQKEKRLELPTRAKFSEFVGAIRKAKTRSAEHCADLTQGLAFTGCRISEAAEIAWADLNFEVGEIFVRGDPEEGTKNSETRRVPMIAEARSLFERMRADREDEATTEKVFVVNECQHSMDAAAEKVGMARITHHDLRHFFATVCIESGVDIPTVSRWLGHKDGGALAMKTYGHLRREHSLSQAQKVTFAATAPQ